jgi:hypothetical protein
MTLEAVEADRYFSAIVLKSDTVRIEAKLNPLRLKDLLNRGGEVLIFIGDEPRLAFDNRHFSPEASVHLSEFKPYVASTHDDEMFGKFLKVEDGGAGEKWNLSNSGHIRYGRPRTDV